jgi:hypothetical protein
MERLAALQGDAEPYTLMTEQLIARFRSGEQ